MGVEQNEEQNENQMSIFSQNDFLELNDAYLDSFDEESDDEQEQEQNKLIEENDNSSESVDEEEDNKGEGEDSDDNSPSLYSSVANFLFEEGIIPSLESSDDIKNADDLAEAVKKEIQIQAKYKLDEHLNNLDLEKIATVRKSTLDLEKIDENFLKENIDHAKSIIYQDLINQGLSEDKANRILKKTIDLGEDMIVEDALDAALSLKEYNKRVEENEKLRYQEEERKRIKEQEQIETTIKKYIFETDEVIKGLPNTKVLQDKVFKSMTEVVAKNPQTGEMMNKFMKDRSEDPIKFDTRMYYLYELTNGFTELGNIEKRTTSKAAKQLESVLRKTSFEDNGTPNYLQDPNSYSGGGFGSELVM